MLCSNCASRYELSAHRLIIRSTIPDLLSPSPHVLVHSLTAFFPFWSRSDLLLALSVNIFVLQNSPNTSIAALTVPRIHFDTVFWLGFSMFGISRRQRSIHAASFWRSSAVSSNLRPSPSRVAGFRPVLFLPPANSAVGVFRVDLHSRAFRPRRSQPIRVEPEPPKKSATILASLAAVEKGALDQFNWLHCGMQPVGCGLVFFHSVDCDLSPYHASLWPATWRRTVVRA